MKVLILDPFYEDSHRVWAEGLMKYSSHHIEVLNLSPHHWKWRMTGGAIELADQYNLLSYVPELIIATDMLDLSSFISLADIDRSKISIALYFHENQITYPWKSEKSKLQKEKNHHYGFINFSACLVADRIFYNSQFHKASFLEALPGFLKMFPNFNYKNHIDSISNKSKVLSLGLELKSIDPEYCAIPCFLWNHRWEHDKNPELFFQTLFVLHKEKINFKLIVLGKSYQRKPAIFEEAKERLANEIIHYGYADTQEAYLALLAQANILLVTSNQDFFGISIVEAIAAGLYPILPRRLAYPEHIEERHHEVFYNNDDEILPKLRSLLETKKFAEQSPFADFVLKYNWSRMIKIYDRQFSEMKKSYI